MEVTGIDWSREQVPGFYDGVNGAACPSRLLLGHVSSKWGLLVLLSLSAGPQRWGELKRSIEGVSEKMLAQTLKILEDDGLVHREAFAVIPPKVEYRLTALGAELTELLVPVMGWIADKASDIVGQSAEAASGGQQLRAVG